VDIEASYLEYHSTFSQHYEATPASIGKKLILPESGVALKLKP
jgi:hypothetical protein